MQALDFGEPVLSALPPKRGSVSTCHELLPPWAPTRSCKVTLMSHLLPPSEDKKCHIKFLFANLSNAWLRVSDTN